MFTLIDANPSKVEVITTSEIPAEPVKNTLVVSFNPEASEEQIAEYINSFGGEVEGEIKGLNSVIIKVPEDYSPPDNEAEIVAVSEPDYFVSILQEDSGELSELKINDPKFSEQWILSKYNIIESWSGVDELKVAVIDSGICMEHEDLVGRVIEGYDFLEEDSIPQDENGHGCSIAGIIAANSNNGLGIVGISQTAKIMPLRVLDNQGIGTYSDVAEAIVYAVDNGADVINLSLGGVNSSTIMENAINYAQEKGVKVYAAAGNNGMAGALYPARYEYVIGVGSLNQNLEQSSFSNFGSGVDVFAPGEQILTTSLDGGYKFVSGTSFASAIVSGESSYQSVILNYSSTKMSILTEDSDLVDDTIAYSSKENPSIFTNHSGITLFIVDDGNIVELPKNSTYEGDSDGIWAKCNKGVDSNCYSYTHNGNTIDLRVFKWHDGSKILAYLDNDGNVVLAGAINGSWQSILPFGFPCQSLNPIFWQSYGSTKTDCIGNSRHYENLKNVDYYANICIEGLTCPEGNIPDNCVIPGNGNVTVFTNKSCEGFKLNYIIDSGRMNYFPPDMFNDSISSIKVANGWSVRVYLDHTTSINTTSRCIRNNLWDLSKDYFTVGQTNLTLDNKISSLQVFNDSNCGAGDSVCVLAEDNVTNLSCNVIEPPSNPTECAGVPDGNYCGGTLGLDSTSLYQCRNGASTQLQTCSYGCNVQPQGTADYCNASPTSTTGSCPNGNNGNYCGAGLGSQYEANSLYSCQNGTVTKIDACSLGCLQKPAGTNDICKVTTFSGSCPAGGNGDYCGSTLGLDPNTLYTCNNGNIALKQSCNNGCELKPSGTPDICYAEGQGTPTPTQEKVKLWGNSDYTSIRLEIPEGTSNSPERGAHYKSITIPSGWSVILYDHPIGQAGAQTCLSSSTGSLESMGWYNSIDAIKVSSTNICPTNNNKVEICTETGKNGNCITVTTDIPSLGNYGFGNDTLKSIYVEGDWQIVLFEDDNYQGRFYQTNSISGDLGGIPFGYGTSSLKIIRTNPAAFTLYKLGDFNDGGPFRSDRTVTDLTSYAADSGNWNDKAQSMRVANGYEVVACTDANSKGSCGRTKTDVADLNDLASGLRNGLSSVVVCKDSCPATSSVPTLISPVNTETFLPDTPISFSWSGNGSEYKLEISGGDLTTPINTGWMNSNTTWNKSGLVPSVNPYKWKVKSWTVYGETQWSAQQEFKIQDIAPMSGYIFGNDSASLGTNSVFQALVSPSAAENLIYTWSPSPISGQGTSTATYNFSSPENSQISVVITNTGGSISSQKSINVSCPDGQYKAEYFTGNDFSGDVFYSCVDEIDMAWDNSGPTSVGISGLGGIGIDGDLMISNSTVDNPIDSVASGLVNTNLLNATNANFVSGQKIMIHQTQGQLGVGTYQINEIESYNQGVITLKDPLNFSYSSDSNNKAQVLVIKQYNQVTISAGATLSAKSWNGSTGGILFFMAKGDVHVDGTISASGLGFRGGSATNGSHEAGRRGESQIAGIWNTIASDAQGMAGGGGGYKQDGAGSGGGGAGHAIAGTSGVIGHINPGQGGYSFGDPSLSIMTFGGGGGSGGASYASRSYGKGGSGGGIVMIMAERVFTSGKIAADGLPGNDTDGHATGAGGGGAGGSIYIIASEVNSGSSGFSASGGHGGQQIASFPLHGGAGSVGRIAINYCNAISGTTSPTSNNVNIECSKDNFSARFTGKINLETGIHTFSVNSDDGARLWLNENLLIDRWVSEEITETANIFLEAGEYDLKLEYFDNIGNAKVKLSYETDTNFTPAITSDSNIDAYIFEEKSHEITVAQVVNPESLVYTITSSEIESAIFVDNNLQFTPAENERGLKKINIKVEGDNEVILEQEISININYSPDEFLTEINDSFENLNNWKFDDNIGLVTTIENAEMKVSTSENLNLPKRISSKWVEVSPTIKYYLALTSKLENADPTKVAIELYDVEFNKLSTPRVVSLNNSSAAMRETRTNLKIPATVGSVEVKYAKVVLEVGDKLDDLVTEGNSFFDNLYFSQNGRPVGNIKAFPGIIKTGDIITLDGTLSSDPDGNTNLTYSWTQIEGTTGIIADNTAGITTLDTSTIETDQQIKVQIVVSDGIISSIPIVRTFTIKGLINDLNEPFDDQDIWQNKAEANYLTSIEDGALKLTSVNAIKSSNIVSPFINVTNKDYTLKYRFKGVNTRSMGVVVYGYDETFKSLGNKNCTAPTAKGTVDWMELECEISQFKDNALMKYAKVRINYSNNDLSSTGWFDYMKLAEFNSAPIWSQIPAQIIDEDGIFTNFDLDEFVTDAEEQPITFSFSGNESLVITLDADNIVNVVTPENWNGEETITFVATDSKGAESSSSVNFTVSPVNDAPTISEIPSQTINQGEAFANIDLTTFANDVDINDTLTWEILGNENINVNIDTNNVVSFDFAAEWFGQETLTFKVTDAGGLSANTSTQFTVNYVNPIPADWWNTAYLNRSKLTVTNSTVENMPANFPIQIKLDETTTPKASEVYAKSTSAVPGNDVRILFNHTTEVDRSLSKFNPTEIEIWFGTVEPISANTSVNDKYTIYYDNPAAATPPANLNKIFQPVVDSNTVGVWRFQEGSGTTVSDLSGKGGTGSFVGASWAQGLFGNAGQFGGTNKYVEIPNSSNYNISRFTTEAWIYLDSKPVDGSHVMSKWTGWGGRSFFMEVLPDKKIQLYIDTSSGNYSLVSNTILDVGKWYHIAGTLDNSNTMRIYVNGVLSAQRSVSATPRITSSPIRIGRAADWPGSPPFPGKIQNAMLSKVAKTNFDYAKISTRQFAAFGELESIEAYV